MNFGSCVVLGADIIEELPKLAVPELWRRRSPARAFMSLRRRLGLSQAEVAAAAGVSARTVSLVEGGSDAKISTWRALYAALGFEAALVPVSSRSPEELAALTRGRRSRAKPRRMLP